MSKIEAQTIQHYIFMVVSNTLNFLYLGLIKVVWILKIILHTLVVLACIRD